MDRTATTSEIVHLHRQRVSVVEMQGDVNRKIKSYLKTAVGWNNYMPADEGKPLKQLADHLYVRLDRQLFLKLRLTGGTARPQDVDRFSAELAEICATIIEEFPDEHVYATAWAMFYARAALDERREELEADLTTLVRELPSWRFVEGVRGVGELGLATIIGEAGGLQHLGADDAGNPVGYSNPAKLWKRLGLAVLDGQRQGNPGKTPTAEDWVRHGYNRGRRGRLYGSVQDGMQRQAYGKTPDAFGRMFLRLKQEKLDADWTPGRSQMHAGRRVLKELLVNIWRVENGLAAHQYTEDGLRMEVPVVELALAAE